MCASAASAGAGRASTPFRPFLQFSRRPLPSGAASPFCGPRAYGGRRDKCGTRRFSVNSASPHLNWLSTFGPINDGGAAFILGAARWMAAGANRDPADAGGDHNDSHLQGLVRLGGVHWCPLNLRLRRQKSLFRNRWLPWENTYAAPTGHHQIAQSYRMVLPNMTLAHISHNRDAGRSLPPDRRALLRPSSTGHRSRPARPRSASASPWPVAQRWARTAAALAALSRFLANPIADLGR